MWDAREAMVPGSGNWLIFSTSFSDFSFRNLKIIFEAISNHIKVYDRAGRSNRAQDPMTRISPHVGNVPGMNVPMGMVMNNQFGKKPPQTRSSNHRYSRRRDDGPLSQEMMTQQDNMTQGSMSQTGLSQTGLSQGISQPMFSQGYSASQAFSQDMHDISQSDSGEFQNYSVFVNPLLAWPKSQLDLLSQDQGYDAYNPSHGRGMDFSQY